MEQNHPGGLGTGGREGAGGTSNEHCSGRNPKGLAHVQKHKPTTKQIITHALVDDQLEVPVEGRALSPGWFLKMQMIFSNAYLKNLKLYDRKVADMCLKQPEKGSGLRTVTTTEMLAADRRLWSIISGLDAYQKRCGNGAAGRQLRRFCSLACSPASEHPGKVVCCGSWSWQLSTRSNACSLKLSGVDANRGC